MSPSLNKKIKELQKTLDGLLKNNKPEKPKKIDDCKSKKELELFTIEELTRWLKKNTEHPEKFEKKHKKYVVNTVWEYFSDSESSESESSESDSDSESETDSDSDSTSESE